MSIYDNYKVTHPHPHVNSALLYRDCVMSLERLRERGVIRNGWLERLIDIQAHRNASKR
jgi:hypothetical protein